MIIPCIDLQNGRAVQLVRGRRLELAVDDILGLLETFRSYPVLHVIDLDAAMRRGTNGDWIKLVCKRFGGKVRVGGGIRTLADAEKILSWGAEKIIVGSAAIQKGKVADAFLKRLAARVGRKNIVIALDTEGGKIVVQGWRRRLALSAEEVIPQLEAYCGGFLCTYVDNEGTMRGTNLAWFRSLRRVTKLPITAAGGIRSLREVRALEKIGMDAAVGMAIYKGKLAGTITGLRGGRSRNNRQK